MGRRFIALFLTVVCILSVINISPGMKVSATEIAFRKAGTGQLTLYQGQRYELGTTINNSNPTKEQIKYSLGKKNIISVSSKGKISALKTGSVYLTAKSANNPNKKRKIRITVVDKKKYKKIKSIRPKNKSLSMEEGTSTELKVVVKPKKASNKNFTYKSDNPKIVTVTNTGRITALKPGKSQITVKTLDESKKKTTVEVTVTPKTIMPDTEAELPEILPFGEYLHLEIDQKDSTVTEIHPSLTGTFDTNGTIKAISYIITDMASLEGEVKEEGNAVIGSGSWEISKLLLSPGRNRITVQAKTYSGLITEKSVVLTYDRGSLNDSPEPSDISEAESDENAAVPYVKNRLILYFKEGITEERKTEILRYMEAKVIGSLNTIELCQVELPVIFERIEEVESYVHKLCERYPEILAAEPEWIMLEPGAVFYDDTWNLATWDINNPSGENWWAEAVNAPKAWEYANKMKPVRIGIVDDGFDSNHEDLKIRFSNSKREKENSIEKHGTHVAGIIGATADNGKGIAGLAWMNPIYGYDWYPNKNQNWVTSVKIQDLYIEAIEEGCKVVNMSLGNSGSLQTNVQNFSQFAINSWGRSASITLGKLLDRGFDFVVVQSAGNGAKDCIGVDAVNNGVFASIKEDNCYFSSKVKKEEIRNRIFIVGAAELQEGQYRQTSFSNGGPNVNITAPGKGIFSTIPGNDYAKLSGTSMAAPMVAATASMIWAINPKFTGEEVQEILLESADQIASDNILSANATGDIPMVNAKKAVETAIKRGGTVSGCFLDAENGKRMQATYLIHKETSTGELVGSTIGYRSDTKGIFLISDLGAGTYVLEICTKGYVKNFATIEVPVRGNIHLGAISLTKKMKPDMYRIVLTWGNSVKDLDAHLRGIDELDGDVHIYYGRSYHKDVVLDLDDISFYGPETITITNYHKLRNIRFAVHNYTDNEHNSNSEEAIRLAKSGAVVKVYKGSFLLKTYEVPKNIKGTLWTVFAIASNGEILDINSMGYERSPSHVLDAP